MKVVDVRNAFSWFCNARKTQMTIEQVSVPEVMNEQVLVVLWVFVLVETKAGAMDEQVSVLELVMDVQVLVAL
jgi:hypothetical protein